MTPERRGSISCVQPAAASRASVARIDDLELEAGFLGDAGAEFFAVLGGPAGFGGDQPRARDAAARILSRQTERVDRAHDRRLADAAGRGDALAQADDAGERVDHPKAVAGRTRHQQPAIVGAEIERRVGAVGVPREGADVVRRTPSRRMPYGDRRRRRDRRAGRSMAVEAAGVAAPRRSSNAFLPRQSSHGSTAAAMFNSRSGQV